MITAPVTIMTSRHIVVVGSAGPLVGASEQVWDGVWPML